MGIDTATAYNFFRNSAKYGLSFTYRGPFYDDITTRILDISENTIAINQQLPKINRKVSFLLVECFQNIVKHGESIEEHVAEAKDNGLFSLKNLGSAYLINSINLVRNEEVEFLQATVENINSKDKDGLKEMYKSKLLENGYSEKGGAGLGLIELARKSGQKIVYRIEPASDGLSYFHQQILLLHNCEDAPDKYDHIDTVGIKYKMMESNDVILEYKGDFSQKSILPIITIIENSFAAEAGNVRVLKKVLHVLIEILQNVSKHALALENGKEGIFLIGRNEDGIFIQAGNQIGSESVEKFDKKLQEIIALDKKELREAHKTRIRECLNLPDKINSGLGLLEIAKASSERIRYDFEFIDHQRAFFSMYVKV